MGTFLIDFSIFQALQVLSKTSGSEVDQIVKDVPPEGGGMRAVAASETVGVESMSRSK
jgi:hypothetical protein